MKLITASALFGTALAKASGEWKAPGPDDFRGPCPMLNTLANHGFLPHDGKALTQDAVVGGLGEGLNFEESLANLMFEMAISANPEPNATYFTLDHLNRHNVLEHDASLSRSDAFFGNNHVFNSSIFETSKAYWTAETITPEMLANSKLARQVASRSSNPTYVFTADMEQFSIGEVAAPIIVFGDVGEGTVPRGLVEYFFENEKLPTELGWKPAESVSLQDILAVSDIIRNATSLLTPGEGTLETGGKRDMHAGGKRRSCPHGFS